MEFGIQEVSRMAGITSRTLRHYAATGLLAPSSVGPGGLRRYDADALVRLQRILLLRGLGLGLPAIARVLDGSRDDVAALREHLAALRAERDGLDRRLRAVEHTIRLRERGEQLMPEEMFDGFDHRRHRDEVVERWGEGAWRDSDAWWTGMTAAERAVFQREQGELERDWADAAARGLDPAGEAAQALATRHIRWLAGIPGTPGYPSGPAPEYLAGLGELYAADPRFGSRFGTGAGFVRDALRIAAQGRAEAR